jgi:RNA polymerase sigma factor (sigma-70 family)
MTSKEKETIGKAFNAEKGKLLNFIRKRIPDKIEAEDILQDVFYQLTIGFRDIERIENLTSWLYRVAYNRIIDWFRKKRPVTFSYKDNVSFEDDEPLSLEDILPDPDDSQEDEFLSEQIWNIIEESLNEIPSEQKEVFVLHEFKDKSFNEISKITGVGVNTLISRKRYAVMHLRKKLQNIYKQFNNN